jgi:AcrR family transcriptional regulator
MSSVPARRAPQQERSAGTVEAVLDAAARLLAAHGAEAVTTSRVAEAAGVSVGALYRFFSDKQEIFDAIALRDLEAFRAEMGAALQPRRWLLRKRSPVGAVIDAYVDFLERHPAFRVLALGHHISPQTRSGQVRPDLGPASILKEHLVKHFRFKPGPRLDLRLRVAAEVGDRLIAFAFEQPDATGRARVVAELKRLLTGYLLG